MERSYCCIVGLPVYMQVGTRFVVVMAVGRCRWYKLLSSFLPPRL